MRRVSFVQREAVRKPRAFERESEDIECRLLILYPVVNHIYAAQRLRSNQNTPAPKTHTGERIDGECTSLQPIDTDVSYRLYAVFLILADMADR